MIANPAISAGGFPGSGTGNQGAKRVVQDGLHNSTQISFLSCAAGTYKGTDVRTGAECTTILTETGQVSFINGAKTIRTFDLVADFAYHMDKTKSL